MSEQPAIKLVIFDFDGTLADSAEWFASIIDELAVRFRFRRVTRAEIEELRHRSSREVIRHMGIPRWKLPLIARHARRMLARDRHKIALFPGTRAMIDRLTDAGVKVALVTSNAQDNALAILGPHIAAKLSWVECGSSLWGKSRKFRRVLARSGLRPHEVLSVGDETRDVEAARAVGMRSGAVLWGYASRDALVRFHPDLLFESADDILRTVLGDRISAAA